MLLALLLLLLLLHACTYYFATYAFILILDTNHSHDIGYHFTDFIALHLQQLMAHLASLIIGLCQRRLLRAKCNIYFLLYVSLKTFIIADFWRRYCFISTIELNQSKGWQHFSKQVLKCTSTQSSLHLYWILKFTWKLQTGGKPFKKYFKLKFLSNLQYSS